MMGREQSVKTKYVLRRVEIGREERREEGEEAEVGSVSVSVASPPRDDCASENEDFFLSWIRSFSSA